MAAARNDPETMVLGRTELPLLPTNNPKLLVALMKFGMRKPLVGGMTHRDSCCLILEPGSNAFTLSPGTDSGGRWVIQGDKPDLWWAGLQAFEGLLL